MRYLTGFTGSNGLALVVADGARRAPGADRFLTDFRYAAQSAEQVPDAFEREIVTGELLERARRSARRARHRRAARLRRRRA